MQDYDDDTHFFTLKTSEEQHKIKKTASIKSPKIQNQLSHPYDNFTC